MRGAMTRIFEVDGIARNGAAKQARLRSVSAWKIGAIFLFFEQKSPCQVFGSPKPVANQQKPDATLHFLNYRVASPLLRPEIGLGVPVASLFSSLRRHVDNGACSFPFNRAAPSVAR